MSLAYPLRRTRSRFLCPALAVIIFIKMEWFVRDICGYICIFFTYFTLTVVDLGVLFFSLKNRLLRGEALAWTHALIFNCIIATIVTAHVRCMTTNPGTLPKQTSLNYKKLPERTK